MIRSARVIRPVVLVALLLLAGVAAAQEAPAARGGNLQMSRAELQGILARYEQASQVGGQSETARARSRYEAALIRSRLETGDFQTGDRISLAVEGEPELTDTFTVNAERAVALPGMAQVSLRGLLRSELQPHLRSYIGRYIRNPVVYAQSLIRISVLGEVGSPGFYVVPSDALVTDALMLAGGPTREADLTDVRVERGDREIWEGAPLQLAITEGRTLDQLSLRAGDRLVVPEDTDFNWLDVVRTAGILISVIYGVTRILN